jgi:two-component system response regulator PilR (NtrC family)
VAELLREEGYHVYEAADGQAALQFLEEVDVDLILSDLRMPGVDGLALLQKVREVYPQTMVVLMTAYASVETVVEALRLGAQDYLLKPLLFDDLLHKVRRLLEHKRQAWEIQLLRREVSHHFDFGSMVGRSPAMKEIFELTKKVAPTNATVLITGESGVGKEVVARLIHSHSLQKDHVFLPVNCSAIPEALLESQLFGHTKGAFTGAVGAQEGLFQRARGGTIFLDEIGEMPLTLQPKLLRAIEEKEVLPVGATTPVKVDVRILTATNRDLKKEIEAGRFREDLYYRLNVIELHISPLRDRREDIPPLVEHLIHRHNQELKKAYKGVDNATMKLMMSLPWKGNVRELDNVLERAMILGDGEWISPADLPRWELPEGTPVTPLSDHLKEAVQAYEKSHIETVLKKTNGDKKSAAELLGLSLSSLYRKLDELTIQRDTR